MSTEPPNLEPWNDPAVEARVVAYILGESSAFEATEVERLLAEYPELAAFARRIRAVHGLLGEEARGAEADTWKLSPERREKVMAAAGATAADPVQAKETKLDNLIRKFNPRRGLREKLMLAASIGFGIMAIGFLGVGMFSSSLGSKERANIVAGAQHNSLPPVDEPEMKALDTEVPGELLAGTPKDVSGMLVAHEDARRRLVMSDEGESRTNPSAPSSSTAIAASSDESDDGRFKLAASDQQWRSGQQRQSVSSGVDVLIAKQDEVLKQARVEMEKAIVDYDLADNGPALAAERDGKRISDRAAEQFEGNNRFDAFATPMSGSGELASGNRSGDVPITRNAIDAILNTPIPAEALRGREDIAKVEANERDRVSNDSEKWRDSGVATSSFGQLSKPALASRPTGGVVDPAGAPTADSPEFEGIVNYGAPLGGEVAGGKGKDEAGEIRLFREFEYSRPLEKPELPAKPKPPASSSASVVTRSGSEALAFPVTPATPTSFETRMVDSKEMIFPTEYEPPTVPGSEAGGEGAKKSGSLAMLEPQRPRDDFFNANSTSPTHWYGAYNSLASEDGADISAGSSGKVGEPRRDNAEGDKVPAWGDVPVVGKLFANSDEKPKQVNVETKFVEVQQANKKELGFDWLVSDGSVKADLMKVEEGAEQSAKPVVDPFAEAAPANKPEPAPPPAPSLEASDTVVDPVSTFSLNVSDASFQMGARALLQEGKLPEAGTVRTEDYVNAMDYGDAMPARGEAVSAVVQQAGHPFVPGRNLVRVGVRTGAVGRGQGQPLALTLMIDQSGSMERPDRAEAVAAAVEKLSGMLQENDMITVIGFSRTPRLLADRLPGARAQELAGMIRQAPPQGGTNLEAALDLAAAAASKQFNPRAQNRIVLITDGAANLGEIEPELLMARVDILRRRQIAFDACGVGMAGVDDTMLEALTRKGDGRYILMDGKNNEKLATELAGAFRPAARNVKIQVRFNPDRVGKFHLYGFEKHRLQEKDFRDDTVDAAELAAAEQGNALYQIELRPDGVGDIGDVAVRFQDTATGQMVERHWTIPYDPQARPLAEALPSMQLAGLAGLLGENLKGSPIGQLVRWPELGGVENNLRRHFGHDPKVDQLLQMVARVRSLRGE